MNVRRAVIAVAASLTCLTTAGPALAADGADGAEPSALGTHLHYRTTTWTSQGAEMSIMAPRHWPLVLTPEGQARFNAHARPDVLAMSYRGEGPLRRQIKRKVAALQGTPGLKILKAHGHGRGDTAAGEVRYLWTPPGGETRFVDYRYQGDDSYMVAGRLVDRPGLKRVLARATDTGECS